MLRAVIFDTILACDRQMDGIAVASTVLAMWALQRAVTISWFRWNLAWKQVYIIGLFSCAKFGTDGCRGVGYQTPKVKFFCMASSAFCIGPLFFHHYHHHYDFINVHVCCGLISNHDNGWCQYRAVLWWVWANWLVNKTCCIMRINIWTEMAFLCPRMQF